MRLIFFLSLRTQVQGLLCPSHVMELVRAPPPDAGINYPCPPGSEPLDGSAVWCTYKVSLPLLLIRLGHTTLDRCIVFSKDRGGAGTQEVT